MEVKYIIVLSLFILSNACTSMKFLAKDIEGTYVQESDKKIQLVFEESSFFQIDTDQGAHLDRNCCDTLAYGTWSVDANRGFLSLTSHEDLNTSFVWMEVEEGSFKSVDSVCFIIDNPIERHYKKFEEEYREILYTINVESNSPSFDSEFVSLKFGTNPIILKKPRDVEIQKFSITIIPKHDISVRNIGIREIYTLDFEVESPKSNKFVINLPQLSYNFINYKRLREDYVKVANNGQLIWDDLKYIRAK